MATAAVACGLVYFIFLRGADRLERMDAAAEAQIAAAYDRMIVLAEARDVDGVFRHVAETDRGALVSNGRLLLTRSSALERTRDDFRGLASVKYAVAERHITPLSPTSALLVVAGTVAAKTGDGREILSPFVQSVVFTREAGEWKVLHVHQSGPAR